MHNSSMMKKALLSLSLVLVTTAAQADKVRVDSYVDASVRDVYKTVTKNIPNTEQICNLVDVPIYGDKKMNTEGAIVGGIIGGIIGNQIGKGGGKEAATGVGAMTGAIIGGQSKEQEIVGYRQEQRCRTRTTYTTTQKQVYSHSEITFVENGQTYTLRFQR